MLGFVTLFSRTSRTLRGATQVVTFLSVTKNVSEAQSRRDHIPLGILVYRSKIVKGAVLLVVLFCMLD